MLIEHGDDERVLLLELGSLHWILQLVEHLEKHLFQFLKFKIYLGSCFGDLQFENGLVM